MIDDILNPPSRLAQARTALEAAALGEAIRALGEVPSGHLYARVMGYMTLARYEAAIRYLKEIGDVAEAGHVLTWVGR